MSLLHLKLEAIAEADLQRLAREGISESKSLEYKLILEIATDDQKREWLSDVTALANTDGGDLIFGIREEKGVTVELPGLKNFVADDPIATMENLLRDFVQPRLLGTRFHPVPLATGNTALVIRVPRSLNSPHMVRHKGVTRFCGRNANGKYDVDVHELRSAFVANETFAERLKSFRLERINRLISGEFPGNTAPAHLLVMHILPVDGARGDRKVSTVELQDVRLTPIGASTVSSMVNFNGFLAVDNRKNTGSYVQVYRNGFMEAVDGNILEHGELIPSIGWEEDLIVALNHFLKPLSELGFQHPWVLGISLLNVQGFTMGLNPGRYYSGLRTIDRDHLLTDEILIESEDQDLARVLRPAFDQVWNACGLPESINYDDSGEWNPQR